MQFFVSSLILGFIIFSIVFAAVKQAIKPILEYIDESKSPDNPTDLGLLIHLRDNSVIEAQELTALITYRNEKKKESINSNKLKKVEPLLKEMKTLGIYDNETFENRLSAVKQFYGITDCTENNIL